MKGKLIVFEGTDGSGKATQANMMAQRLREEGYPLREIDFPRYGNPFAEPARLYLAGALGDHPGDVNAYAASTLFAVDRYASYKEDWGKDYEAGRVILANRYTTSNAVHQASKLATEEQAEYVRWLFDLEYGRLGLPVPDLVIYLDVPTDLSEGMLRRRGKKEPPLRADGPGETFRDGAFQRICKRLRSLQLHFRLRGPALSI